MTISDRIAWQREEALATIVALEMLDLPAGQSESTENFVTLTKSEGNPLKLAMLRLQIQVMLAKVHTHLVPRPHPLSWRNGLVNQVEFLGLAHTFVTVLPSNVQNVLRQTQSKKGMDTRVDCYKGRKIYCCKGSAT